MPTLIDRTRTAATGMKHRDNDGYEDEEEDDGEDARVILHFDLDAFYVACERELNPQLRGVPVAVSQYNPYGDLQERSSRDIQERWVVKSAISSSSTDTAVSEQKSQDDYSGNRQQEGADTNGSLIAVSYEARASGVKRNQRGKEACQACKNLNIVQVPVKHGKADLTMYRTASKRVMEALKAAVQLAASKTKRQAQRQSDNIPLLLEVASIDEVYMDVTTLANQLVEQALQEAESSPEPTAMHSNNNTTAPLWQSILESAGKCTTIGGVEVLSKAAQATNALGKDELRRGSHVQVLDSNQKDVDSGSKAWWRRCLSEFSNVQLRLVCGAYLAAQARAIVESAFDGNVFTLSAGISTNKTLAKLASGLKKPNRQTLIYREFRILQKLFHPLPLGRIRGLGGKFGSSIASRLNIETVGQVSALSLQQLQQVLGKDHSAKTIQFLHDISRGLCTDPVTPRNKPKSIECSKTFRGPLAIPVFDQAKLKKWVGELCSELQERLQQDQDEHHRKASTIKVGVQFSFQKSFLSKQGRAPRTLDLYPKTALEMIQQLVDVALNNKKNGSASSSNVKINCIAVGGMQFVAVAEGSSSILSAIQKSSALSSSSSSTGVLEKQQSDNDIATTATGSTNSREMRFAVKRKRSRMEQWLQDSSKKEQEYGNSLQPTAAPSRPQPEAKRIRPTVQTTKQTDTTEATKDSYSAASLMHSTSLSNSNISTSSTAPCISMPRMEEIDEEVLKALPIDIQRAVLGDIRQQQKQQQKKPNRGNGIQSFFKVQRA